MDLSPKQIVYKLDKYIIGQDDAKKAVAIALRNRYRRAQLPVEIREERPYGRGKNGDCPSACKACESAVCKSGSHQVYGSWVRWKGR